MGIAYGSSGITLQIDHNDEATSPVTQLLALSRNVSLGDFTESPVGDERFGFAFVGEVDWIRSGPTFSSNPVPAAHAWARIILAALIVVSASGFLVSRRREWS